MGDLPAFVEFHEEGGLFGYDTQNPDTEVDDLNRKLEAKLNVAGLC